MNFISTFEELNKLYEEKSEKVEEACTKEELTEAAEDEEIEIVADEEAAEEAPTEEAEEEDRQVICECDKCGALVIRDEADIVVNEESDLVNVEDACEFCEETAGYRIIGVVAPYDPEEVDMITEDIGDWYRRKFDKPASTKTQQAWEDELNDDSISTKRRKHLERKFLQQRDWEARHKQDDKDLDEILDVKIPVSVSALSGNTVTANGNDVAVGGATV